MGTKVCRGRYVTLVTIAPRGPTRGVENVPWGSVLTNLFVVSLVHGHILRSHKYIP